MRNYWIKRTCARNIEAAVGDEMDRTPISARVSDSLTEFVGSWAFIISFLVFAAAWMALNVYVVNFDPPPFIGLNLWISFATMIMGSLILMSQRRQEQKDRKRALHGYEIGIETHAQIESLREEVAELKTLLKAAIKAAREEDPIKTI